MAVHRLNSIGHGGVTRTDRSLNLQYLIKNFYPFIIILHPSSSPPPSSPARRPPSPGVPPPLRLPWRVPASRKGGHPPWKAQSDRQIPTPRRRCPALAPAGSRLRSDEKAIRKPMSPSTCEEKIFILLCDFIICMRRLNVKREKKLSVLFR